MAFSNIFSATSTPSVLKVFHTVELMEMILLEEYIHDLFVHQRVCKAWLDTIRGSSKLLQKMFLLPTEPPLTPASFDANVWHPRHLYQGRCIAFNPCASVERVHRRLGHSGKKITSDNKSLIRICMETPSPRKQLVFSFYPLSSPYSDSAPTRGVHHPTASWRRMLITQPPLIAVDLYNRFMQFGDCQSRLVALWNMNGITFGDVHDGKSNFSSPRVFIAPMVMPYCVRAAFLKPCSSARQHHSADPEQMRETEDLAQLWEVFKECKGHRIGRDKDSLCRCLSVLLHGKDIPEPKKQPSLRRRISQTMPWGRKR